MPATAKSPTRTSKKDSFDFLDGRVNIYRTTSKVWQFRMWISEEKRYVIESLRTEDRERAKELAEQRYIEYRSKVQRNEKIFSITADELRTRFLEHIAKQVSIGQLSEGRERNIKTFTKHYVEFVGRSSKIQNIDPKQFREYLSYRRGKKADILATVVANESVTIKQMYRFATEEGLINQLYLPDFGVIKRPDGEAVRESYTPEEYTILTDFSQDWYKKKDAKTEEDRYYRRLIHDFILIMANGGFRTQEARLLKWKDIKKIIHTEDGKETYAEIVIRPENTKTRKGRTIEIRRGDVFERIKKYSNYTEREDFVFSRHDRNEVLDKTRLYDWFGSLVKAIKETNTNFDESKTLYSLRHLFISMRILAGLNVYDIAKITGTSLVQIQKHYDAITSLATSRNMNKNTLRFDKHHNVIMEPEAT